MISQAAAQQSHFIDDLMQFLVCAVCHGELSIAQSTNESFSCVECRRQFKQEKGVFSMIPLPPPELLQQNWSVWEELQKNGSFSYETAPELNLASVGGDYGEAFRKFLNISGLTLDIGCGPQRVMPMYAGNLKLYEYIGLDPLIGYQPRDFRFIHGVGEFLPFRTSTFQNVIASSSLDHMMDFEQGLREMYRVLQIGGYAYLLVDLFEGDPGQTGTIARKLDMVRRGMRQVFVGLKKLGLPRLVRYVSGMSALKVPDGALDYFHIYFPKLEEVKERLQGIGFQIEREERFRDTVFLAAKKV